MKNWPLILVLAATVPLTSHAADPQEPTPLASRITDVTVYADRARVTRSATLNLPKGVAAFRFEKLPGWLDDASARVSLSPASAGQILDVQVRRTFLAKPTDQEFLNAQDAVQDITDQMTALQDEQTILDAQSKQVEAIRMFSLEKLPKDVAAREIKPEEYGQTVEFIGASLRKIAVAKRDLEKKRRQLEPEKSVRLKTLNELQSRAQLEESSVTVLVQSDTASQPTLTLNYMLPGATWEPVHELRATRDGDSVALASFAVVMQTTGEDWSNVNLALSTQSSTETMKIPELEALLVGGNRAITRFKSSSTDSFSVANQNFMAQNGAWNTLVNPKLADQQEFLLNCSILIDNSKRVEQVFQALTERGTTAHFKALASQTLRTDGRQVRVPIGSSNLSAQHRIIAAPELSLNAAHTVDLTNTGTQSLLPGKVSLYLGGAFLGLTETGFVAPGESFSLYLGVADQIKLSRILDRKRSELKRGGRKTKMKVTFLVTVENLSDNPVALQLTDRIPVSEDDDVRVSSVRAALGIKPDSKGLLSWDLSLAPKGINELQIEYALEYPNELPNRQATPSSSLQPGYPPSSLQQQIIILEKNF